MKLNKSQLSIGILFLSLSVVGILFAFSKLTPSASPSSTYHSLNDIYTLITAGTEKATPNSVLTTSSSPSATTSHSTTEIYLLLANKFKSEDLRPGTNIFGIVGTFGTPDANYEEATSSAVSSSLTPTYTTDTLPTYTLEDIYSLINDSGTRITVPNHTFSSSPSVSMHTTTEIYNRLDNLKTYLTSNKFGTSTSIFGVTGSFEPVAQLNEGCSANDECYTGWCDYGYWGVCTNGAIGDTCYYDDSCASGYCDSMNGICTDGSVGSGCYSSSNCVLGYCDNVNTYTCTDGSVGSGCGDNSSCSSPNICDTGTYTCVDGSNGAACTSSLGCSSGHCYGDVCTAGTTAVSGCDSSDDCESGYCNTINNICSSGAPGSACGGSSECDTYNCVSNVCSADLPPITSGLVGYWPLNETSGTVANDLSGNGNNGTLYNGVLVNQAGKVGTAFSFDGTNDYVKPTTFVFPSGSVSKTMCGWIKDLSTDGNGRVPLSAGKGDPGQAFSFSTQGYPRQINFWGGYDGDIVLGETDNGWHYVCSAWNGLVNKVYIDGSYAAENSYPLDTLPAYSLSIGKVAEGNFMYWKGLIDEVAIWDRPLAPAEITTLYNGGIGVSLTP